MSFLAILRIILACIALSLCIVKLVHKDKHTAIYWACVTVYWTMSFIEHIAASAL